MDKKVDILVVGGGPAGVVSAVTARQYYPDKKILVIKSVGEGVIPCGIPYMLSSLKNPEENILGNASLKKNSIGVVVDKIVKINREEKSVYTKKGDKYSYEKLILAIGSTPVIPPIPGIEKKGIYPIHKDIKYLKDLVEKVKRDKNILVLGGGFIGVEFADELSKIKGCRVYLVEMLPHLLANSFDPEFSQLVEKKISS